MSLAHICNIFFEQELEEIISKDLISWIRSHPIVLQLQFLPLLYADPTEIILVTDLPERPDPRLCLLEKAPRVEKIEDWGASRSIAKWAKERNIPYQIPDWEIVRTINSKIFSFQESPKLPGSALLNGEIEVGKWIESFQGPKVLKTAFGTAGRGHFHVGKDRDLQGFLRRQRDPVIGEPWVERVFDFSTQWKNGTLLGATVFENEPNGTYKGTRAGEKEKIFGPYLWALEEHLQIARPLVKKIERMGFFGNLGIDAYIYRWEGKEKVQPVVEINGRKTMSWVALQLHKEKFSFERTHTGALPQELEVNGKRIRFQRNIICE